jgi:hypothetical protein
MTTSGPSCLSGSRRCWTNDGETRRGATLRAQGWTYPRIAARFGVSPQAARGLVIRATEPRDAETVWVRLTRDTHERLQSEYGQERRRKGEPETVPDFRRWLSERAVRTLEAGR